MSGIDLIGMDSETHLIAAGDIIPRMVCATFDFLNEGQLSLQGEVPGAGHAWGRSNGDPEALTDLLEAWQRAYNRSAHLVFHEAPFDICVYMRYCQDVAMGAQRGDAAKARELYMLMWEVLDQSMADELAGGRPLVHCTILREKLYNLSTHGGIDNYRGRDLTYNLHAVVLNHFGVDISGTKVSTDQHGRVFNAAGRDITGTPAAAASWRLRYNTLDGVPFVQFPPEAAAYAIEDATWARMLAVKQERLRQPRGHGSMNSESLQVYAGVALRLFSAPGFRVDNQRVQALAARIDEVYARCDGTLRLNGILRPDGSVNKSVLKDRVKKAWATIDRMPMLTAIAKDIACGDEVLVELDGIDPILDIYTERVEFSKLRDAFLPNLMGERVWSNYDTLKETGRVSSYGNSDKAKRKPLYPAVNIQQIPRGDDKKGIFVRECFLPPVEGHIFVSCDYSALELCSVAQVTYTLLGASVHRDKNLLGYDLHSFLGAGMASILAPHLVDFQSNRDEAYKAFLANRKADKPYQDSDMSPEAEAARKVAKDVKHYRNFAKPTGLGYPGGLGPNTFVTFAKTTYHVTVSPEQATTFRELWRTVYPEMPQFFKWLGTQTDAGNMDSEGGDTYWYETQGFNRMRAGAGFCAAANGKSMQSLSADGAKRGAICWVARACYGGLPPENPFSLLQGCLPCAFIHDEDIVSIPDDDLATERALLVAQLMVVGQQVSMPDVKIAVEPAAMRKWTKSAEPEWIKDEARAERVRSLVIERGGPQLYEALGQALGTTWKPHMRLLCWDDVHTK